MLGQIIVTKRSAQYNEVTGLAASSPLSGAVFGVYSTIGNLVDRMVSDARGVAASKPLPLGIYFVREVSPPKYYALNTREFSVSLQGSLGSALCTVFQIDAFASIPQMGLDFIGVLTMVNPFNLFVLIGLGYCIIKIFFANIKRGGILVINIAVGSMYMLSVPRGLPSVSVSIPVFVSTLCQPITHLIRWLTPSKVSRKSV